jgi:hypothetical protein
MNLRMSIQKVVDVPGLMGREVVAGELLFRPFFLRIPTQCNNVTLGRKRLNRVFGRHWRSFSRRLDFGFC